MTPRLPKILEHMAESRLGISCTVTEVVYFHANLKRVRFRGDLGMETFVPGQEVKFRVSEDEFRHYTPTFFDLETGVFDVLFYLQGDGPGAHWASALKAGDTARMLRTAGKMRLVAHNRYHFFFGDETSLGLFRCLKEAVHQKGHEYLGILELAEGSFGWPEKLDVSVDLVPRSGDELPAQEAIDYLNDLHGLLWKTWKKASFYLAGRAASIEAFREALLSRGVSNDQISTHAYWSDGKKGYAQLLSSRQ